MQWLKPDGTGIRKHSLVCLRIQNSDAGLSVRDAYVGRRHTQG